MQGKVCVRVNCCCMLISTIAMMSSGRRQALGLNRAAAHLLKPRESLQGTARKISGYGLSASCNWIKLKQLSSPLL
jgi:hypothetical protein